MSLNVTGIKAKNVRSKEGIQTVLGTEGLQERHGASGQVNITAIAASESVTSDGQISTIIGSKDEIAAAAKIPKKVPSASKNTEVVKTYNVNRPGCILVLNNTFKVDDLETPIHQERIGSEDDVKAMKKLFEETLKNKVFVIQNVEKSKLQERLKLFKKKCEESDYSFCAVIVMSYGNEKNELIMNDGEKIDMLNDLVYQFDHQNFPQFEEKPKLFFIQAEGSGSEESDNLLQQSLEEKSCLNPMEDTMIIRSGLPLKESGSDFIQNIDSEFTNSWNKDSLNSMNKSISNKLKLFYNEMNFGEFGFPCDSLQLL